MMDLTAGRVADAPAGNWVDVWAPAAVRPAPLPFARSIRFERVRFEYPTRTGSPALDEQWLNDPDAGVRAKGIAALLICLAAAAALAAAMNQLNPTDYARSALIVFTLCQILYQTYWKPSDIAPAIERATG